jgi:hypothetical protein
LHELRVSYHMRSGCRKTNMHLRHDYLGLYLIEATALLYLYSKELALMTPN